MVWDFISCIKNPHKKLLFYQNDKIGFSAAVLYNRIGNMQRDDYDVSVTDVKRIVDAAIEKNEKGGDNNTYEWVAEGVKPEKDNLQNLPPEASCLKA